MFDSSGGLLDVFNQKVHEHGRTSTSTLQEGWLFYVYLCFCVSFWYGHLGARNIDQPPCC